MRAVCQKLSNLMLIRFLELRSASERMKLVRAENRRNCPIPIHEPRNSKLAPEIPKKEKLREIKFQKIDEA